MPNKPHPTPKDLTSSWSDKRSVDAAGEAPHRFGVHLCAAMGDSSIRSVAADAGVEDASLRRVPSVAAWPHVRTTVLLEESLGVCLYTR